MSRGKYNIQRTPSGMYAVEFDGITSLHRTYDSAYNWADLRCKRASVHPVTKGQAFANWVQIGSVLGISWEHAEQIGLRALVKIREALLDDPMIPSLLEHLRINTKEHKCEQ